METVVEGDVVQGDTRGHRACVRGEGFRHARRANQRGGIGIRSIVGTTHTPLNLYRSGPLSRSSTEMNSFNFFKSSEPFKMIE